ncbi:carboxypeptidase B-like [Mytilus californianus]|uniref:carboxypeptidase B-like n=1 Tax=Mytilus californianus TaxID=6549 RepID=UPI0022464088|nr:carboxypeptidase B-like [Mytilus californianus]
MRNFFPLLLLGVTLTHGLPSRKKRFDGNQVLRILPKSSDEILKIVDLGKKYNVDIWKIPKSLNSTLDIHVDAHNLKEFVTELKSLGTNYMTWIEDLQKLIENENSHTSHVKARASASFSLSHYHSSYQISNHLNAVALASRYATVHTAGHSVQGRSIKYLKISSGGSKKAIIIDGGIHAREWISTAVVMYLIDQLAMNPDNNPEITSMLQKFDWYLLPLMNPDGYEYSRTNNRMWRKNRASSHSVTGTCTGVDLNRNFGFHWNPAVGGSRDECEETFAGTKAFSEPEALAAGHLMQSLRGQAIAYLNLHSYGQLWLWPWGYTTSLPSDLADLKHMAGRGAAAIYPSHHAHYTTGGDATDLYPAAGGADDFAKGGAGIKYSYTVELRDNGRHGFVLPASTIIPSGEETLKGIIAFASELYAYERL